MTACAVTTIDVVTADLDATRWEELGSPQDEIWNDLEVAHIIPYNYASYENTNVRLSIVIYSKHVLIFFLDTVKVCN